MSGTVQELTVVERTLHENGVYAFASKFNSLVCWTFIHLGFPIQNIDTSQWSAPAPTPVKRWYIPPTKTFISDLPALPSPGHILLRGRTLVGDFRLQATPLPALSDLLSHLNGWNITHNQDWTFFTLNRRPALDIVHRLVAFNDRLISLERLVFGELKRSIVSTLVLVLWTATLLGLLILFRGVAIALAWTPTCGHSLNDIREVYGDDTIVRAARGGPTTLAHGDSRPDEAVVLLTKSDLLHLITYVPCSTYSVLLFVNANRVYKRPVVQNADNPPKIPVCKKQFVETSKTKNDKKLEDQGPVVETPATAKGERTKKARRGKRGGVAQKAHQAKKLEWQKAVQRVVDTWGSGAWLEKGLHEEIEMIMD
ncbi:hypothetical protein FS749_016132 [Ceratobasidium sp. UAMH 11750]|nr:hypothetical protein FS749_016132 [Ceratobasidium sp. UAMH 11750]